jgi:hypothetical protein
MARNGSGTMTIPNTLVSGTTITASDHNENYSDIATELTNSIAADGQTSMSGALKLASGTAAAPSGTFGSDTDTGTYRRGSNEYGFTTGGVAAAYFDSSQKFWVLAASDFAGIANFAVAPTFAVGASLGTGTFSGDATFSGALTMSGIVSFTSTDYVKIASGTTAQRPAAAAAGRIRWNSTTGFYEADDGSNWKNLLRQSQLLPADFATGTARVMIKRDRVTALSNASGNTQTPNDNSAPQVGEGTEVFTASYTPANSASLIKVRCVLHVHCSQVAHIIAHLHKDGAADAVRSAPVMNDTANCVRLIVLEYEISPGSISAITFALRAGPSSAATLTFNGSATLGSTIQSFMEIQEWLAP